MSQQPEMRSLSLTVSPAPDDESAPGAAPEPLAQATPHGPQRLPRWLERTELYLRVMLRIYIGLAICYAPWNMILWDRNPLFLHFPTLAFYATNGAVRGLVSGLGLLNLWIAFQDAFRFRNR